MTRLAQDVDFRPQFTIERGIARYAAWLLGDRAAPSATA
jgi:nucleoside-diphosphate-sugar epimerase